MKELKSYYNIANLSRGATIAFIAVVILILLGAVHSYWALAAFFVLVTFGTPALMARNDAINKWEEENHINRM